MTLPPEWRKLSPGASGTSGTSGALQILKHTWSGDVVATMRTLASRRSETAVTMTGASPQRIVSEVTAPGHETNPYMDGFFAASVGEAPDICLYQGAYLEGYTRGLAVRDANRIFAEMPELLKTSPDVKAAPDESSEDES